MRGSQTSDHCCSCNAIHTHTRARSTTPVNLSFVHAQVVFESGSLGLQLETGFGGEFVVIKKLVSQGQAASKGLTVGQVLYMLHGQS